MRLLLIVTERHLLRARADASVKGVVPCSSSGTLLQELIYFGGQKIGRRESDGRVYDYFADHPGTTHALRPTLVRI